MKNIGHVILVFSYIPGSAHVNRILGYKKGYEACGKKVTLIAFCLKRFGTSEFLNGDVVFCQEPNIPLPITRRIIASYRIIKTIREHYNPINSVIHIYNTPLWAKFLDFSYYDVFFEKTEIPFYAESKNTLYNFEQRIGKSLVLKGKGLLCISHGLKDYYSMLGVKHIEVINMFVDSSRFDNLKEENGNKKIIFYCGNISFHKDGVDILVKAFKILHDKYPEYKLKLVGGFERLYNDEESLRYLINELKLEDSIILPGKVQASKIPQEMVNSSILVLARPQSKQATYGFPTKVGEYLCANKPVVLTDVGEISRFLKDGDNCILSEPNNIEQFASKMIWTIEHNKEARSIAMKGNLLVKNEFSAIAQSKKAIDFMSYIHSGYDNE